MTPEQARLYVAERAAGILDGPTNERHPRLLGLLLGASGWPAESIAAAVREVDEQLRLATL